MELLLFVACYTALLFFTRNNPKLFEFVSVINALICSLYGIYTIIGYDPNDFTCITTNPRINGLVGDSFVAYVVADLLVRPYLFGLRTSMIIHHVVFAIMGLWLKSIGSYCYIISVLLISEISTIFLTFRDVTSPGTLNLTVSIIFAITFFAFRVAPTFYIQYIMYFNDVDTERSTHLIMTAFMLAIGSINLYWIKDIIEGAVKVFVPTGTKSRRKNGIVVSSHGMTTRSKAVKIKAYTERSRKNRRKADLAHKRAMERIMGEMQ